MPPGDYNRLVTHRHNELPKENCSRMPAFYESDVDEAAMEWLSDLRWETACGPEIVPGTPNAEWDNYAQVVLEERVRDALERLNLDLDEQALETAFRRIANPDGPSLETRNHALHLDLIHGVAVDRHLPDGTVSGVPGRALDFDDPMENDWLAVNQFRAQELVETMRNNITVDWTLWESVRANMRIKVRRVLNKGGYPPDKQPKAVQTVIQQAELLSEEWAPSRSIHLSKHLSRHHTLGTKPIQQVRLCLPAPFQ